MSRREQFQRAQSIGGYSRRDGDDLGDAVYALSGPLILLVLASLLQTSAAADNCQNFLPSVNATCTNVMGYSLALGLISVIGMLGFFVAYSVESLRERLHEKTLYYMSISLLLWWSFGVAFTTFQTTTVPDLRYFSSWLCLLLSAQIAHSEFEQFASLMDKINHMERYSRSIFYLCLSSLVVTASSVFACVDVVCEPKEAFGISIGLISFVMTLALWRLNFKAEDIANKLAVLIAVLWFFSVCILTLLGPFRTAGNGFFSSCACFLLSFYIAHGLCFPFTNSFGTTHNRKPDSPKAKVKEFRSRDGDNEIAVQKTTHAFFVSTPSGSASTMPLESIVDPDDLKHSNSNIAQTFQSYGDIPDHNSSASKLQTAEVEDYDTGYYNVTRETDSYNREQHS